MDEHPAILAGEEAGKEEEEEARCSAHTQLVRREGRGKEKGGHVHEDNGRLKNICWITPASNINFTFPLPLSFSHSPHMVNTHIVLNPLRTLFLAG